MKNQNGFSAIEISITIFVMALIGVGGWYVWRSQQPAPQPTAQSSVQLAAKTGNPKSTRPVAEELNATYHDPIGYLSAQYPATWKVKTDSEDLNGLPAPIVQTTVTSPKGTVLNLRTDWGGKGGDCVPAETDVPFAGGNQCPSIEYLSIDGTKIDNVYSHQTIQTKPVYQDEFKLSDIIMVSAHYADTDGKNTYVLGLKDNQPYYPTKLRKPVMGFITSSQQFVAYDSAKRSLPYVSAYAQFDNEAALHGGDALTVRQILSSVRLDTDVVLKRQ